MNLYKYRPLSEFLFKELYYQEIYFASYEELNDPFDLSARIDFRPNSEKQIDTIIWYLLTTSLKLSKSELSIAQQKKNEILVNFSNDKISNDKFRHEIYKTLIDTNSNEGIISLDSLVNIITTIALNYSISFEIENFKIRITELVEKFINNSFVTCLSEKKDDFLMWSHYASKHSGVCLEFSVQKPMQFPFKYMIRKAEAETPKPFSKRNVEEVVFYENLTKVDYEEEQPSINFFEFSPVFINEHDCDLIGISKPWVHAYANKLKTAFSKKTIPWKHEKEWRAIQINFEGIKTPEERIWHYPIECLSSIYFGAKTPDSIKKRIHKLYSQSLRRDIQYFDSVLTAGREIKFENWLPNE